MFTLREFVKQAQQVIDKWDGASFETKCNGNLINPNVPVEIVISDLLLTELADDAVKDIFSGKADARDCFYSLSVASVGGSDTTEGFSISTNLYPTQTKQVK